MHKDNAVGNVVAETGRDGGTTTRLSDLSMPFPLCASPLKGEVQRSPEPSARPLVAAESEERQICTTCFFAESVGLCLCFLPSSAMYKDNAVGNVVAEMGRDFVFMTTARLSDLSMPLKARFDAQPEQSARQPIARNGKFVRRAYSPRALDCEKSTVLYAFSYRGAHVCLRGDLGIRGRGEIWPGSPLWNTKTTCQNHKQQQLRPRSGPSIIKGAQTQTTRVKVQQVLSKYRKKESN